jgi:hypothetical protein
MNKMKITALIILLSIIAALLPAAAVGAGDMDVVLVMDSSGSMKKTDPHFLRIPAAKLFISLLRKGDRASVVSFSDKGYVISPLIPVSDRANISRLNNAADRISSKGLFTNLYEAFNTGMRILADAKEPGREKIILIMTDGMMDTGDTAEDGRLLDLIDSELLSRMKEQKIRVYSIAFTRLSDQKLLAKISKKTGGFYNLALTDKELHLIFTSIFESLKKPDMLPMSKNGFLVDSSVREVTIVATKGSPETEIQLLSPDGQKYSGNQKYSGIAWFASETFDMITIERPLEGRWEILMSTGKGNKAYVITDLSLKTNFNNLYSIFGQPMDINIWLEKNGEIIVEPEVLEKIEFYIELTGPDGKTSRLEPFLKEPGIFERKIAPFTPGNYTMNIVAKGKTFEREKTFVFSSATVEESKEDIKEQKVEAEKAVQPEVKDEEPPAPEEISWTAIALKFIAINLILGIGVFVYLKRSTLKKGKLGKLLFRRSEDDEDAEEDEDYTPPDDETVDSADTEEKPEAAANKETSAEADTTVEEKMETDTVADEATEKADESPAEQEEANVKAEEQPGETTEQTDKEKDPPVKIKLDADTHEPEEDKENVDNVDKVEDKPVEHAEGTEAEEHDLESADDTGEVEHEEKQGGAGASQAELAKLEEELLSLSQEGEGEDTSVHHEADPADFLDKLTGKDEPEETDESADSGAEIAETETAPEEDKSDVTPPEIQAEQAETGAEPAPDAEGSSSANDQNVVDDLFEQLSSGAAPQATAVTDQQDDKQEPAQELQASDESSADEAVAEATQEQAGPAQDDQATEQPDKTRPDRPDDPEPAGAA